MCPDFFPGCFSGGHCYSHNESIFTSVCIKLPSRTWPTAVGIFFSRDSFIWTTLNFSLKILKEDPRYWIWMRSVNWFTLYDRRVRQTDRNTHTHTHAHTHTHTQTDIFLKHIFRLWEWCRIKIHKKSKSNFLTIAIPQYKNIQ